MRGPQLVGLHPDSLLAVEGRFESPNSKPSTMIGPLKPPPASGATDTTVPNPCGCPPRTSASLARGELFSIPSKRQAATQRLAVNFDASISIVVSPLPVHRRQRARAKIPLVSCVDDR